MSKLKDKIAVITGGSSGIGLGCARRFTEEGAKVVIFGKDSRKLEKAKELIGKNIETVSGDVRDISDLDRLFKFTSEKFGKVDILLANAGVVVQSHVMDVTEELFDQVVGINFKGVFFTVKQAIPYLDEHASVILTSSGAAHNGPFNLSLYSSVKSAVSQLARCFASDLFPRKIRVNAISPGCFDTEIFKELNEEQLLGLKQTVPLKRFGDVYNELTPLFLYLASDDSKFMNGSDLIIDAGASRFITI